jgi:hypothetical protein
MPYRSHGGLWPGQRRAVEDKSPRCWRRAAIVFKGDKAPGSHQGRMRQQLTRLARPEGRGFSTRGRRSHPRVRTVVPTLSFSISDFTVGDTGSLAVVTPQSPTAFSSGGSLTTVNGRGFCVGTFPSNRAHHDFKQRGRASMAPPAVQRRGFCSGKCP